MEYELTIKDENGKIVCENIPIDEKRLEQVSIAAGGLQDYISKYKGAI